MNGIDTAKYKSPNVKKLPATSATGRVEIGAFLEFMRERTELNLNNHRVAGMNDKTAWVQGMIRHLRDRLATLNFLISINDQRKALDDKNGD